MAEEKHSSPHDALFKHVFGTRENAVGLLRSALPSALVVRVDWERLELRSGSYTDERLAELESDLLFQTWIGETPVLMYVLVEHQSSSDPRMPWRLWRYVTRIWEKHANAETGRLPVVVPLVVYHGARSWNAPRSIAEMIDVPDDGIAVLEPYIPRFEYVLDDLMKLGAEELRARVLPAFGALALFAMRTASDRSFVENIAMFVRLFDRVLRNDGAEAFVAILHYLSVVTGDEEDRIIDTVLASVSEPARREAMTHYERLMERGRAEGEAKGKAELVTKLLTLKFGGPSPEHVERIRAASVEELDRWAERILNAAAIDDVFA